MTQREREQIFGSDEEEILIDEDALDELDELLDEDLDSDLDGIVSGEIGMVDEY